MIPGPWPPEDGPPRPTSDRRAFARVRTLLTGKLSFGQGLTQDCAVRNVSRGGASIRLLDGAFAPDTLDLIVVKTGVAYSAQVIWRNLETVGLVFRREYDLQASPMEAVALRRLWIELVAR